MSESTRMPQIIQAETLPQSTEGDGKLQSSNVADAEGSRLRSKAAYQTIQTDPIAMNSEEGGLRSLDLNTPEKVQREYQRAMESNDAEIWYALANEFWRERRLEDAAYAFDNAFGLNASNRKALYYCGIVLNADGYHEDALECYDALLALNPEDQDAYVEKGRALMEMGSDDKAALQAFHRASTLISKMRTH